MNWLINRARLNRERIHLEKVKQLQKENWDRIKAIEDMYQEQDYFAPPDSITPEKEFGFVPDAREKYLFYLLNRVGIGFIPQEALQLARSYGPALAAERVCRLLGLDYHKIAAVAPRVASETARATRYFQEMQDSTDLTGINADPLLPHIHFGSHDTRDILFENFRTSSRVIELYDTFHEPIQEYIDWESKRPLFVDEWKEITSECLMRFYNQGILLTEYQKTIDTGARLILYHANQSSDKWLKDDETVASWQKQFPEFDVITKQVHISNLIREVDYRCAKEWIRMLKKVSDTDFNFDIIMAHELILEE